MIFLHTLKYSIKSIFKDKVIIFWTLVFPLLLATLFKAALGNIYESTEIFRAIPVAVVDQGEGNDSFHDILNEMADDDDPLFTVKDTDEDTAVQMLEDESIVGIFYADSTVSLTVSENGAKQTVCSVFLKQYLHHADVIGNVIKTNPAGIQDAVDSLTSQTDYTIEKKSTNGDMNDALQYFYALFGMTALYATFLGVDRIIKLQANLSPLGARRGVSPVPKIYTVLAEFLSCLLAEFLIQIVAFLYVDVVLGIHMGTKIPAILLLLLMSSAMGVSLGIFIGSIPKLSDGVKTGICVSVSMFLSFCSGLMFGGMKMIIEKNCPLFAKLNPASLIVDSFYALNIYDTYSRFLENMMWLTLITLVLFFLSVFMTRRNKYASL